jgi:hypothetical protein
MLHFAISLVFAVSPVVQPVSSGTYRDGGSAVSVRVQGPTEVLPAPYQGTLFGHTRSAQPYTLGDVINNYGLDPYVWGVDGGGTVLSLPFEAALRLEPDGGTVSIETHRKFRYQAARQQTILQTVVAPSAIDAGVVRWGNYCYHDGLYWQRGRDLSTPLEVCIRTGAVLADGGSTDSCVAVDAGVDYRPENGNIYEIRFAWLGVHEVDWYLNGRLLLGQNFDGKLPQVYMGTATLPLRADAYGDANLKYICSNVTSEGGQFPPAPGFSYSRPTGKVVAAAAGILPIVAIRPTAVFNGAHAHLEVVPTGVSCTVDGDPGKVRIYGILSPATLTGASWAAQPLTGAEADVSATAYTGGLQVCTFTASDGTHEMSHVFGINQRALMTRALGGGADVLLIAADSLSGNQTVTCAIEWQEVR